MASEAIYGHGLLSRIRSPSLSKRQLKLRFACAVIILALLVFFLFLAKIEAQVLSKCSFGKIVCRRCKSHIRYMAPPSCRHQRMITKKLPSTNYHHCTTDHSDRYQSSYPPHKHPTPSSTHSAPGASNPDSEAYHAPYPRLSRGSPASNRGSR
jgi:hypothetical protein